MTPPPDFSISGQYIDVTAGTVFPAEIQVSNGRIARITHLDHAPDVFLMPGFVDAHVHIESSMLVPSEFARLAVVHGTVATVSDPHEIGNVLGIPGVIYMSENGKRVPFHFHFGAPSCVPATPFETAGAEIGPDGIEILLRRDDIHYLAEMMNFPGVLNQDPDVMAKIRTAHALGKPVDGHAPGLKGEEARRYIEAGISTDHECFTLDEALDKLKYGMKILIREGSAAKNYEALKSLVDSHPGRVMFCSDDKHPNDLVDGHINLLLRRGVRDGLKVMNLIRSATLNPVLHYGISCGLAREGEPATFIEVEDLTNFRVLRTWVRGELVAEKGKSLIRRVEAQVVNRFDRKPVHPESLRIPIRGQKIRVIEALDGQLITPTLIMDAPGQNGMVESDPSRDLLKIVVVNRYENKPPACGLVKNFGLKQGAIASTVAHDSHNIVAVGVSDADIAVAINLLVASKGGVSVAHGALQKLLPLAVAGLMSPEDGYTVAREYEELDRAAKALGATLAAPFMTLSFMALLVIPELKLSDKGLFDGTRFQPVGLFVET
jgi:adenine deaminase